MGLIPDPCTGSALTRNRGWHPFGRIERAVRSSPDAIPAQVAGESHGFRTSGGRVSQPADPSQIESDSLGSAR